MQWVPPCTCRSQAAAHMFVAAADIIPRLFMHNPTPCVRDPIQVYNPRNKQQQVFVITLGRAGEDNRSFRLTNIDSTLSGFAGADYDMLVRRLPMPLLTQPALLAQC